VALTGELWQKIAESPQTIEYFRRDCVHDCSDSDSDVNDGDTNNTSTTTEAEMDILTALVPLMGSPHVGRQCKESLLLALSSHIPGVEQHAVRILFYCPSFLFLFVMSLSLSLSLSYPSIAACLLALSDTT
jgi:hypothetical protein